MQFSDCAKTTIPFGAYINKTIDEAASTDRGLLYLDWMRGVIDKPGHNYNETPFHKALTGYLNDPSIARELDNLVESSHFSRKK